MRSPNIQVLPCACQCQKTDPGRAPVGGLRLAQRLLPILRAEPGAEARHRVHGTEESPDAAQACDLSPRRLRRRACGPEGLQQGVAGHGDSQWHLRLTRHPQRRMKLASGASWKSMASGTRHMASTPSPHLLVPLRVGEVKDHHRPWRRGTMRRLLISSDCSGVNSVGRPK